jgi:hypothetical protein
MRRARPFLLIAFALACDSHQTAIVLEAHSELSPGAVDEVLFAVSGPGLAGGSRQAVAPLSGPEAREFPLTLVLLQDSGGAGGPFSVAIEGHKAGTLAARAVPTDGSSPVAFVDGQVVRRRFVLRAPDAPSAVEADAGAPAPPAPDAAPMMPEPPATTPGPACPPAVTCPKEGTCGCPAGCACQLTCAGEKCQIDCAGAGTTCQIDLGAAKSANIHCSDGASCVVRASGDADKRDAKIACSGATCLVACGGPGCQLMCAGSMSRVCEEEVRVCNRDCP